MVRRSTWILLAVFVLLVVFAWLFQRNQTKKADSEPTATAVVARNDVYNLTGRSVTQIKIADSSGNKIGFYRDDATSSWAISDVAANEADSLKIQSVSTQLLALQAQAYLDTTPALDSVGLITPTYTITMTTSDGGQLVTYVGNLTPIGTGYYVRVGTGPVLVVAKVAIEGIVDLLQNPPLLATPTPEVTETETPEPTGTVSPATPTP